MALKMSHLPSALHRWSINPTIWRDEDGAERFMVFDPGYSRDGEWPDWYRDMTFNSARGPRCCSHEAVAFHKISMADMKVPLSFLMASGTLSVVHIEYFGHVCRRSRMTSTVKTRFGQKQ